jgi:hypothetical protein
VLCHRVASLDFAIINEAINARTGTSPLIETALADWAALLRTVMQEEINSFVRGEQHIERRRARQEYQHAAAILARWECVHRV